MKQFSFQSFPSSLLTWFHWNTVHMLTWVELARHFRVTSFWQLLPASKQSGWYNSLLLELQIYSFGPLISTVDSLHLALWIPSKSNRVGRSVFEHDSLAETSWCPRPNWYKSHPSWTLPLHYDSSPSHLKLGHHNVLFQLGQWLPRLCQLLQRSLLRLHPSSHNTHCKISANWTWHTWGQKVLCSSWTHWHLSKLYGPSGWLVDDIEVPNTKLSDQYRPTLRSLTLDPCRLAVSCMCIVILPALQSGTRCLWFVFAWTVSIMFLQAYSILCIPAKCLC